MTYFLKHNDHVQFEYHDVYLGPVTATYRVYSVISDALQCGANPVTALKTVPEDGTVVQLRRVPTPGVMGASLLWQGKHVAVCEGQTYILVVDGPSVTMSRAGT